MHAKKRRGWRQQICEAFDFSYDSLGAVAIQMVENKKLVLFGCYTIDKYSDVTILVNAKGRKIEVLGERLCAKEFGNGRLEINGIVHSVLFGNQKENCDELV